MAEDQYNDIHRAFLQTISHVGLLNTQQALKILIGIYGKYFKGETIPNEDHLQRVVTAINGKIRKYDQRIALMTYPLNEMDFYVFYHEHASPLAKFQNIFTEDEIYFFRLVLGELAIKSDHKMKPIECLNMIVKLQGKGMTKLKAEKLLERFQKRGYLFQTDDYWYFGPRTIMEFGLFLAAKYPDTIEICSLCKNNVYWGTDCQSCKKQFHKDCMKTYLKKTSKCPNCKERWSTRLV